jgi:transposase
MRKFMDVFGRCDAAGLNQMKAVELLGVGKRPIRHWCRRYEDEACLLNPRIGRASVKRVPLDRCEEVERLYGGRYQGFTARHFHEHLLRHHRFAWRYSWTKAFLLSRNLLVKAHRRRRPRRRGRNDAPTGRVAERLAHGCEPRLCNHAATFDERFCRLRLAGAGGLAASAAQ